jgi:hypothetical protein
MPPINWHSPMTWFVIVGGGVALFLLYQHFFPNGLGSSASSTSSDDTSGDTEGYTEENIYQQTLEGPVATKPPTKKKAPAKPPTKTKPPVKATPKPLAKKAPPKEEGQPIVRPIATKLPPETATKPVADTVKTPTKPPIAVINFEEREEQEEGTGPGDPHYVHTPTWPYGGQMVRPRLR